MNCIDVRSDTVTVPTLKMREAMRDAEVGDDVYGEDPTISRLIHKATEMFGKEAGLFVPSGVMSNQIAAMSWTQPGDQIILWENSHMIAMENGSLGSLARCQTRTIESESGILTAEQVQPYIRKQKSVLFPKTSLICIENATGNGNIWSIEETRKIKELAERYSVKVHTDGARIFNAAVAQGVDVRELAKYTDSICFCLSKGLCSPYGSVLLGPKDFIQKANYNKKSVGGGIRQGGFLAAAGLVALQSMIPHLDIDHKMAKLLASKLSELQHIEIDVSSVTINMIFFGIGESAGSICGLSEFLASKGIKFLGESDTRTFRIVTHHYIREKEVEAIVKALGEFLSRGVKRADESI